MGMEATFVNTMTTRARLDELKSTKGRLSRLMGEARVKGECSERLLVEFKQVSDEIKLLQKRLKKELNTTPPTESWAPKPIDLPPAIINKPPTGTVSVDVCGNSQFSAAEAYVAKHPGGSVWHRPVISSFISQTYGHRTRYLCAFSENKDIVGLLPLVQLKSQLFGNFLVSMPYFNYGGLLADSPEVAHKLIEAGDKVRQELSARHIELRYCRDTGLGLPQRTDKVTFWLPLPDNHTDLWDSFQPKLRSQIRRGERERTEVEVGGEELLEDFYRVFSVNMRDLGTPVYGKKFFRNLLSALGDRAWLVTARIDGRAVGCAFLTGYRNRMEIPWASTLRAHNHRSVNMIMYWRILQFAIDRGFEVFDFGRCSEGGGTYHFKQQWGAQPLRLYWDYVLPEDEAMPALNPDNPRFRLLIAAWRRLPVWGANLLGPHIVRVLP